MRTDTRFREIVSDISISIMLSRNRKSYLHHSDVDRARFESQSAVKSSGLNAHSSYGQAVELIFLAWASIAQWVCEWGIQSTGDYVSETSQVRILHSTEENNMSPFDSNIACLCQSIEITGSKLTTTHNRKSYLITVTSHECHGVSNWRKLKAKEKVVFPCRWPFVWGIRWSMANDAENFSYSWGLNESTILDNEHATFPIKYPSGFSVYCFICGFLIFCFVWHSCPIFQGSSMTLGQYYSILFYCGYLIFLIVSCGIVARFSELLWHWGSITVFCFIVVTLYFSLFHVA